MVSDIGKAHLQTYERNAKKQSKEYFFESRKGAQSLYHPLNGKVYIMGGLGRCPLASVECFEPYYVKFEKLKTIPTRMFDTDSVTVSTVPPTPVSEVKRKGYKNVSKSIEFRNNIMSTHGMSSHTNTLAAFAAEQDIEPVHNSLINYYPE